MNVEIQSSWKAISVSLCLMFLSKFSAYQEKNAAISKDDPITKNHALSECVFADIILQSQKSQGQTSQGQSCKLK